MNVTIEGKEYTIDTAKAIELGICKEIDNRKFGKDMISVRVGDVFMGSSRCTFFIISGAAGINGFKYHTVGADQGLEPWSSLPLSKEAMADDINTRYADWQYIGNINEGVRKLVTDLADIANGKK